LADLHDQIAAGEAGLVKLKRQFAKLKGGL
jgi:hypothetical protein